MNMLTTNQPSRCLVYALVACILLMWKSASAGSETMYYRFKTTLPLQKCDNFGRPVDGQDVPPDGAKFTITGHDSADQHYIIRIWSYRKGHLLTHKGNKHERDSLRVRFNYRTVTINNKGKNEEVPVRLYYLLKKADLEIYAMPLAPTCSPLVGAAVMPFKLRPQDGDARDDLSIGAVGGWNFHINSDPEHSLGLALGLGVASVNYDSLNTTLPNGITDPVMNSKLSAISLSAGLLYQWKRLQIMAVVGVDKLRGPQRKYWDYEGQCWLGFGIGVSIFSADETVSSEGKQGGGL